MEKATRRSVSRLISVIVVVAAVWAVPPVANSLEPRVTPFTDPELVLGSSQAPVTVVEYLSTTCSHCAAFDTMTFDAVQRTLIGSGKLRYVVREMPTSPIVLSSAGFLLARCTGTERYWASVRRLMVRQTYVLSSATLPQALSRMAEITGLNDDRMHACLSDEELLKALNARREAGLTAGVNSTPTFVFNGRRLDPGDRWAGRGYVGGELSLDQFLSAFNHAAKASTTPIHIGHRHAPSPADPAASGAPPSLL